MLYLLGAILLLGVVMLLIGLRGRVVGDDPYCAKCGFNLRGLGPGTTRCPECGADFTAKGAIDLGEIHRRRVPTWVGAVLLLAAGVPLGTVGWRELRDYDWMPVKPTSWLSADVDQGSGPAYDAAVKELSVRVVSEHSSQAQVNRVIDAALERQADRTKQWNASWLALIDAAQSLGRLTPDRLARYVRQGTSGKLIVKPRLRRGQEMTLRFDVRFDRVGPNALLRGECNCDAVTVDDITLFPPLPHPGEDLPYGKGASLECRATLLANAVEKLADGRHTIKTGMHFRLALSDPFFSKAVTFDLPLSAVVELCPANATVDEFETNEKDRVAMQGALAAKVGVDPAGRMGVFLRSTRGFPHPVAAQVVVAQAGTEQKVGRMIIPANQPPQRQLAAWCRPLQPPFEGPLEVRLIPDQSAADAETALANYWGEPVILRSVMKPLGTQDYFVHDPNARGSVTGALFEPVARRPDPKRRRVDLTLFAGPRPLDLAWRVYLAIGGTEQQLPDTWIAPHAVYFIYCASAEVDPFFAEVDIILRSDPDWMLHTSEELHPWDGEIVLRHIKIAGSQ